jgi:hypothetical protein
VEGGEEAQDGEAVPPPAPIQPSLPYEPPAAVPAPTGPQMIPVQWVVTVDQREVIRAAIRHAQETAGLDNNSAALTEVCRAYLASQGQEIPS